MILHNDIDMPFAKPDAEPVYLAQMKALLKRHPKTTIIWAHIGPRAASSIRCSVSAEAAERTPGQLEIVEAMLDRSGARARQLRHLVGRGREVRRRDARSRSRASSAMLNRYPDRFLFGTDTVAPAGPEPYFAVYDMCAPVWRQLTPEASLKVRKGNYERLFDEARRRVRAWETGERAQ